MAHFNQNGKAIIYDGPKSLFKCGFDVDGKDKATGIYNEPWGYRHFRDFAWRPTILQDTELSIDTSARRNYLSLSRQMFGQMGILEFALELICDWAIGNHYDLIYTGPDKEFGNRFEDFANNTWARNCSVKGSTFNLQNILKLIIREVIRDGDILQLYEFSRSGFPRLRYVRSHRIWQRDQVKEIKEGRYAGYEVVDGVVKNAAGFAIGYYIQDNATSEDDIIVNTRDCSLIFNPKYMDMDRGVPAIIPSLLDALSIQELDDAYQRRLKMEALIALKIENKPGEALPHNTGQWPPVEDATTGIVPPVPVGIEVMKGGAKYIEYGHGDITTLSSTTPNIEATKYLAGLETKLLGTIGVPHQLLYSPTDISRAPARGISEIFKKTISKQQTLVEQFIYPAIVWAIGNAIKEGMISPPAADEKWWKYIDFTRPSEFTLDALNESKQQMESYKLGLTTRDAITTSREGKRGTQVINQRTQEIVDVYSACIEVKKQLLTKYGNDKEATNEISTLSINSIHNVLELLTPNGQQDAQAPNTTNNNNNENTIPA